MFRRRCRYEFSTTAATHGKAGRDACRIFGRLAKVQYSQIENTFHLLCRVDLSGAHRWTCSNLDTTMHDYCCARAVHISDIGATRTSLCFVLCGRCPVRSGSTFEQCLFRLFFFLAVTMLLPIRSIAPSPLPTISHRDSAGSIADHIVSTCLWLDWVFGNGGVWGPGIGMKFAVGTLRVEGASDSQAGYVCGLG